MKRWLPAALALVLALVALSACGSAPAVTTPAPTQTARIIVVTKLVTLPPQPTQTPWIVVATPTRTRAAAVTPTGKVTKEATANPTAAGTAAPGATTSTMPGATATQTPTLTARPTATPKYAAPVLLSPALEERISRRYNAVLRWQSVGNLAEDEYYHVKLRAFLADGTTDWYGDYRYVKDTTYTVEDSFMNTLRAPEQYGPTWVYWWVSVVRKTGQDENGKPVGVEISPPSDTWFFIAEPKAE